MEFKITHLSTILGILSVIIAILVYLHIIDPLQLYFNANLILHKHEYWRLFTSLFYYGPLNLNTLVSIYFFIRYISDVEGKEFSGRPADFILFFLIGASVAWYSGMHFASTFLGNFLSDYVFYYNCKKTPEQTMVLLFFPVPFKQGYFPYISLSLFYLLGQNIPQKALAYITSHIFFFIHDVLSLRYNKNFLRLSDKLNSTIQNFFN